LEPFAARLSAQRASAADLHEMRAAIEMMRDALSDRDLFAKADLRFHRTVAKSTGNFLLNCFSSVVDTALLCATLLLMLEDEAVRKKSRAQHIDLHDAIAARDGDRAARLMTDMIALGGEAGKLPMERSRCATVPIARANPMGTN
jgi:DNA-binding FadR family transcriptional regulator